MHIFYFLQSFYTYIDFEFTTQTPSFNYCKYETDLPVMKHAYVRAIVCMSV